MLQNDDFAVVVSASDKYLWSLKPFSLLFNKYWSAYQKVIIAGYTEPDFQLPENFFFYSIAKPQYSKERWADGMLKFLHWLDHPNLVLFLEDYWISRDIDTFAITSLCHYLKSHHDVLRVDLTGDRLYAGGMKDIGPWDHYDMIEAEGSQYQMSLQTGLWNKEKLIEILDHLRDDKRSAWDVELDGTEIINRNPSKFRVIGTRQWPIRYANGMNNAAGKRVFYQGLRDEDILMIEQFIPQEYKG